MLAEETAGHIYAYCSLCSYSFVTPPTTVLSIWCRGLWVVCLVHYTEPADTAPHTYWVLRDCKSGQSDGQRAAEAPREWCRRGDCGGKGDRSVAGGCCCGRVVREGSRRWDLSWALKGIRKTEGEHSRSTPCQASHQTGWARTQQPTECDPAGN